VVLDGGTDEKIEAAFAALAPQHVSALLEPISKLLTAVDPI
jgi:hypothetical protein